MLEFTSLNAVVDRELIGSVWHLTDRNSDLTPPSSFPNVSVPPLPNLPTNSASPT